jgi:hypothetical protein
MRQAVPSILSIVILTAMTIAGFHQSGLAQDVVASDKQLRTAYCLGYFNWQKRQGLRSCVLSANKDSSLDCQLSLQQGEAKARRLERYLYFISPPGDLYRNTIATAQGDQGSAQCLLEIMSREVSVCISRCIDDRKASLRHSPASAILEKCRNECTSTVCKKTSECWNYDPW